MESKLSTDEFKKSVNALTSGVKILTVGDVGIDKYIYGDVSRISPEAPVPVLRVTRKEKKLGMSANICNNLNALGVSNSLISIIGADSNGEVLRAYLKGHRQILALLSRTLLQQLSQKTEFLQTYNKFVELITNQIPLISQIQCLRICMIALKKQFLVTTESYLRTTPKEF